MEKDINEILTKYANEIIADVTHNLDVSMAERASQVGGVTAPTASQLRQEISFEVMSDGITLTIPFYAEFINEGVKGNKSSYASATQSPYSFKSKMPPPSVFSGSRGWIAQKGMIDKKKLRSKGLKGKKLKEAVVSESKKLSFLIAKSIQAKGITGYHFIDKTINSKIVDNLMNDVADFFGNEIFINITKIKD